MKPEIKTILLRVGVAIFVLALIGATLYAFVVQKIVDDIFQRGVEAGKQELNTAIINNLFQFGGLQINIPVNDQGQPDLSGQNIGTVILTPLQQPNEQDIPGGTTTTPEGQ